MITLKFVCLYFTINFIAQATEENTRIYSKIQAGDYTHINRITQVNQPRYIKWNLVADKTSKTPQKTQSSAVKLSRHDFYFSDNVLNGNHLSDINTGGNLKLALTSVNEHEHEKDKFIEGNWSAHRTHSTEFTGQFQIKQTVTNGRVTRSVHQNTKRRLKRNVLRNNNNTTLLSSSKRSKCPRLPKSSRYMDPVCTRGRKIGSRCALKCKPGYFVPSGKTYRRCKRKQKGKRPYWTGGENSFKCVPICSIPPKLDHGSFSCRIIGEDFACKFSCAKNYKLWGSEHRKCIFPSHWTGDPPSCTLQPEGVKVIGKASIQFEMKQNFTCGNIKSLTTFKIDKTPFLVTADYQSGSVKIYKWDRNGIFLLPPVQEIFYFAPLKVEILTDLHKTTWLLVANIDYMTYYRLMPNGLFVRSHSNSSEIIIPKVKEINYQKKDTIAFAELRGDIYRCYGRNRRQNRHQSPVVIVQKLQGRRKIGGRKTVFQRIMRKRLSNEYVRRCSMYADRGSIYTIVALNKEAGAGRIIIGEASNRRRGMKVVTTITGDRLNRLSDSVGFSDIIGDRYIVAGQDIHDGKCILYKRVWKPRV